MILEPLAGVLSEAGIAVPVFIFHMPASAKAAILLRNTLDGALIDHELGGLRRSRFQTIVRHTDYELGHALAKRVQKALTLERIELPEVDIKYILPRHEPVVYPISEGNLLELSVNFDAVYAER